MDLLLAAQSARLLAHSARRAGFRVWTLDCHADVDTCRLAEASLKLPALDERSARRRWLTAAAGLSTAAQGAGLVYGSGVDNRPGWVGRLARGRLLLGNSPASLRRINRPRAFFRLLADLAIPTPETRFARPPRPEGWLVKPNRGEGGLRVRFFSGQDAVAGAVYYQRLVSGTAVSALFLADGKTARIIGFNTQRQAAPASGRHWLFSGAVNRAELSDGQRAEIADYADRITQAAGLVGLNSLDLIVGQGRCRVLEVNPRPSASMALYDDDFSQGLLSAHIDACLGQPLPAMAASDVVRAQRIVFAPCRLTVDAGFEWPPGAADLPHAGTLIGPGEPVCSLLAEGWDAATVEARLLVLENAVLARLQGPKNQPHSAASAA